MDRQTKLILKQLGTEHWKRGKLQEGVNGERGGVKNHRPWGSSPAAVCCSVVVIPIHTQTLTNTQRHKQTQATDDLTVPASLDANHSAQPFLKGGTGGRKKGRDGWGCKVGNLQPSIISCLSSSMCWHLNTLQWHVKRHESCQTRFRPPHFILLLSQLVRLCVSGRIPPSQRQTGCLSNWMNRQAVGSSLMVRRSEWPTTHTHTHTRHRTLSPEGQRSHIQTLTHTHINTK